MNTKATKQQIREIYLSRRNGLSPEYRTSASRTICDEILKTREYSLAGTVLLYSAVRSEVSLEPLFYAVIASGRTAAFPRCGKNHTMEFRKTDSLSELAPGMLSIPEPSDGCRVIEDGEYENALCVIPCVAADVYGFRIGYGGGYYDRFLSRRRGVSRICVCFDAQVSDKPLPYGAFDERYTRLITEKRKVFL